MRKRLWIVLAAVAVLAVAAVIALPLLTKPELKRFKACFFDVFDTYSEVIVYATDEAAANEAMTAAHEELLAYIASVEKESCRRESQAIVALARDPGRRLRMGEAARAWARANDADATAGRFEEIYRETRGTPRGSAASAAPPLGRTP